jgi:phage gp46-like protein
MKTYSWKIDPDTGDYEIDDTGKPVRDESLLTPAYIRLKTPRKGWMYSPDRDFGSDFSFTNRRLKQTPTLVRNVATRALAPMVTDGRALEIFIDIVQAVRHGVEIKIDMRQADGKNATLDYTAVAV